MVTPIYILGPCSAESREQVIETAQALRDVCGFPFIFRAGVWKPRTSPHTFQGAGEAGLEWLAEVKRTFGIPVATEVATPEHVEAAMKAGIDYVWIGARSSANPIAVGAIGSAISEFLSLRNDYSRIQNSEFKGIFIKNPVNADAELWLGNIERIEKAVYGVGCKVYAIHRGCGHKPCWSMAHKVRLSRPDIPMLLDPSHMSGDAAQVPELIKKIEELGLDGAMIEVHNKPAEALSDAKQQISPADLTAALLDRFTVRPASPVRSETELNWLRAEIDELDDTLWETIAARMDVSRRIGEWKKAHGVAPLQPERYRIIGERLAVSGERLGLSKTFIDHIWELIHEESLKQQV